MIESQPFTLPGADGQTILGDSHMPDGEVRGVFIVCHGFTGYKDYGFIPWLAEQAAMHGFIAHRFNFSHSGMTNRVATFERPDLFERDTWSKQIFDLQAVATAVRTGRLAGGALPMVWFGHSRGGVTVLLAAARAFASRRDIAPAGVVVAAAPVQPHSLDEAGKRILRKNGFMDSPSSRTKQMLRVGRGWLDEMESEPQAFDPLEAMARVECPSLIVHGEMDATVPVEAAQLYAQVGGARATVRVLENANHVFNGRNPLPRDKPAPRQLLGLGEAVMAFAARCVE